MTRKESSRLTKKYFEFYDNWSKDIFVIKEDLDAASIVQADITNRKTTRHNVFDWNVNQKEKRKKIETV